MEGKFFRMMVYGFFLSLFSKNDKLCNNQFHSISLRINLSDDDHTELNMFYISKIKVMAAKLERNA